MSNRSLRTNQEDGDDCMIASVSSPSKTAARKNDTTATTNENRTMAVENGQRQRALVVVDEDDDEVVANDSPLQQLQQQVDARDNNHETVDDNTHAEATTTTTNTTTADDDSQLQQQQRQEEEDLAQSIELARMLMAEEAMASYQQSFQLLRDSADQLSPEDYNALQAAMMEDERDEAAEFLNQHRDHDGNEEVGDDDEGEGEDEEQHLSYETLLQLGERIGDVKAERWAMEARVHIARLPTEMFHAKKELASDDPQQHQHADDSELKCLVCQHEYEDNDTLRRLVCGHCFHADCVDQWLTRTDQCPYCRTSIIIAPSTTNNNE